MSSSAYTYDQAWEHERQRLAGLEALWDPGTEALLADAGAIGGAVLEAGAGGGSIVSWLASRARRVLAVDLDTRFVEPLASDVVEVRTADLVTDDLPSAEFDVVHTRLVLEHLNDRDAVLDKLVAALRPGGVLVVEDYDWTAFGVESADGAEERVTEAILAFMGNAGFDRTYGRKVVGALAEHGLADVRGDARALVIDAQHPGYAFFQLSLQQLAPAAVGAGLMTQSDADLAAARFAEGTRRIITPALVAAIGTKPT